MEPVGLHGPTPTEHTNTIETANPRSEPKRKPRAESTARPSKGNRMTWGSWPTRPTPMRLRRPFLHGSISPYEEQAWVIFISNNLISPITVWRIMPRAGGKWKQQRALSMCLQIIDEGQPLQFYSAGELRDRIIEMGWRYDPPSIRELGSWLARDRYKRFISTRDFNGPKMYRAR